MSFALVTEDISPDRKLLIKSRAHAGGSSELAMVMQKGSRRFPEGSFFRMCWVHMSAVTSCRGLAVSGMSSKLNLSRGQSLK